jgi:hypothetical protein
MRLTPNFTLEELARGETVSPVVRGNLQRTAEGLQRIRDLLGVPMTITSGYRPAARNAAVEGASNTSSHLTGLAADFVVQGRDPYQSWDAIVANLDRVGAFDQLIFYPATGHIHAGYDSRNRRQLFVKRGATYFPVALPRTTAPAIAPDATQTPDLPPKATDTLPGMPGGLGGFLGLLFLTAVTWWLSHTGK